MGTAMYEMKQGQPFLQIFWVDDEPLLANPWRAAVDAAFGNEHVSFHTTVRETIAALDDARHLHPALQPVLIWDMMMPTEPGMDPEAVAWGTRTGRLMFNEFRRRYPHAPTILLSHLSDYRLIDEFGRGELSRAWIKSSTAPGDLVRWIQELVAKAYPHRAER